MNFVIFLLFHANARGLFCRVFNENVHELNTEWYIPTVIAEMIRKRDKVINVLSCESNWFGVTYAEDKPHVMQALADQHQRKLSNTSMLINVHI